jgi:hypothetical protein
MEMWTGSPWVIVMSLSLGIGAFIISKILDRMTQAQAVPREMVDWYPELERAYLSIVVKNRELLEAVRAATELRKSLPPEYQAILDQVLMLARLVENASFEQAVQDGVVPRQWLGGPVGKTPDLMPSIPPPAQFVANDADAPALSQREWINGQLLLKSENP